MANRGTKRMMEWRLYPVMAERGIRNAAELQRRLAGVGVEMSHAQISRLVAHAPRRLSSDVMWGLTTVLECTAADLWRNPNVSCPTENAEPCAHG